MYLLPKEREKRIEEAIQELKESSKFTICEPCDCGSHIRHNNGGNYHEIIHLVVEREKGYVKYDTTCELTPETEWEECDDPVKIIKDHSDWL